MSMGKRIVIFGLGKIFEKYKKYIPEKDEIIAYIVNDENLHGKSIHGAKIYSPNYVLELEYDLIILMSDYAMEMKIQLLKIGCSESKIVHYVDYFNFESNFEIQKYISTDDDSFKKSCLIITSMLGYHGGALVAVYMALELQKRGYRTIIVADKAETRFLKEFLDKGLSFYIISNLQYLSWQNLKWVNVYDYIIVNTYPMVKCALEISKHKKVLFWLHESIQAFSAMDYWIEEIRENIDRENLRICAVSKIAKNNFIKKVKDVEIQILPYGIPDMGFENIKNVEKKGLNFGIVGEIYPEKQQLLFLQAVDLLGNEYRQDSRFFIVGAPVNKAYTEKVLTYAEKLENVVITGELSREEINVIYNQLDVLVIPSEETMSLIATEAMMKGKVCIVSDAAGMAEYVEVGENGLICRWGSVISLEEQMTYCLKNVSKLEKIKGSARKTYEDKFSLYEFGNRLEKLLLE